ncbi:DNA adenine methylase [Salmonella enterica subsp. enterica]|uniref:site-specific DNA-methyltransferase (adenine-specific) n=1 Tax=Salmonella enterica I TaxID=59201 RepID=A0A379WJV7_SALET|nr:DNA adenine methylase [Salmonella enterica subsp. enterica]
MGRGKYPLLDDIKRHLPKGECLVEPFVVPDRCFLTPTFLVISSPISTATLLASYNIVKLRTDEYVQASRELFMPETNQAEVYYQLREEFNTCQDPFRRRYCFYI